MALGGIIAKLLGRGALLGRDDDGLDPYVERLHQTGSAYKPGGRGYTNTSNPAQPPRTPATPTSTDPGAGLDAAVASHGVEVAAAVGRLEGAIRRVIHSRKASESTSTVPAATTTGKKDAEADGGSGAAALLGLGGDKAATKGGGIRSKLGGLKGKIGTGLKMGAGGIIGSALYMGGEYVLGGAAQGIGEAIHGKDKVAKAAAIREQGWGLFRTPELRTPESFGGPAPAAKRADYESQLIRFAAENMKFDFINVTGLKAEAVTNAAVGMNSDDSGDHTFEGSDPRGDPGAAGGDKDSGFRKAERAGFDDLVAPTGTRGLQPSKKDGEVTFDPSQPDVSKRGIQPFQTPSLGSEFASPVVGSDLNDASSVPYSGGTKNSRSFGGPRGGGKLHTGVDIPGNVGDPILATQDGVIRRATKSSSGYGYVVDVEYADGTVHRNAHLDHIPDGITVGTKVKSGETIGNVGHSGNASESFPHNHYEVIKKDYYDRHDGLPPGRETSIDSLNEGRIDPREYYKQNHREGEDIPTRVVPLSEGHGLNIPRVPDQFSRRFPAQPQGAFVGTAAPYQRPPAPPAEARPKTVVKRSPVKDEKDERKAKKNKFDPDKKQNEDAAPTKFADYLGVGIGSR